MAGSSPWIFSPPSRQTAATPKDSAAAASTMPKPASSRKNSPANTSANPRPITVSGLLPLSFCGARSVSSNCAASMAGSPSRAAISSSKKPSASFKSKCCSYSSRMSARRRHFVFLVLRSAYSETQLSSWSSSSLYHYYQNNLNSYSLYPLIIKLAQGSFIVSTFISTPKMAF